MDCVLEMEPTNVLNIDQKFEESNGNKTRLTPSSAHQGVVPTDVLILL